MNNKLVWLCICVLAALNGCAFASLDATATLQEAFNEEEEVGSYELILESKGGIREHFLVLNKDVQRIDYIIEEELIIGQYYIDGVLYEKDYEGLEIVKYEDEHYPSPKELFMAEMEHLLIDHNIELIGDDKLLGRDVFRLMFQQEERADESAELWVDKESFVILKMITNNEVHSEAVFFQLDPSFEDEQFIAEDDLFTLLRNDDAYSPIRFENIKDLYEKPMFLPEKEHNGWTLTESLSIDNGQKTSLKLTFEDENGKELELLIRDENEGLQFESSGETEIIRENEVFFTWQPSFHSAYWSEEGYQYILFTKRDLEISEAVLFIETMVMQ
ncbi:LolA family protein [Shouchella patagoniensis]|uniref:LolA family protein n=1 Tax=Shouchella patagoniensis TaxID=228576 RepID=UPI000995A6B7|nr:hypothetical protein [Shouchella patagoniensis]